MLLLHKTTQHNKFYEIGDPGFQSLNQIEEANTIIENGLEDRIKQLERAIKTLITQEGLISQENGKYLSKQYQGFEIEINPSLDYKIINVTYSRNGNQLLVLCYDLKLKLDCYSNPGESLNSAVINIPSLKKFREEKVNPYI